MIAFCNLLLGVAFVLDSLLFIFMWVLIIYFVASWFSPDPNNVIYGFVRDLSEAVIAPMRRYVRPAGNFDMASLATLFLIYLLQFFLVQSLQDYGQDCRFAETTTVSEPLDP